MNERIKELQKQALVQGHWSDDGERFIGAHVDMEKFAELIVRECVSKIGDEYKDALDDVMEDWDRGFLGGLSCAMDTVQKHFGVEE